MAKFRVALYREFQSRRLESANPLKHIKSLLSGVFSHGKRQGFFDGVNPVQDTAIPQAPKGGDTHAYSLEEVTSILAALPGPAATVFAVAAFMGLRRGEIGGLLWENYQDGEMSISRSIWNGHITEPKTKKSAAAVPVIKQLRERLEIHRMSQGNPSSGPIFTNHAWRAAQLEQPSGKDCPASAESLRNLREGERRAREGQS